MTTATAADNVAEITRAARGWYRKHARALQSETVDDVVQEAFAIVCAMPVLEMPEGVPAGAYFTRLLGWRLTDWWRRVYQTGTARGRYRRVETVPLVDVTDGAIDPGFDQVECADWLERLELPAGVKYVVRCRVAGASLSDIGRTLGLSPSRVCQLLRVGREQIRLRSAL